MILSEKEQIAPTRREGCTEEKDIPEETKIYGTGINSA
jgi:hypothetical protein